MCLFNNKRYIYFTCKTRTNVLYYVHDVKARQNMTGKGSGGVNTKKKECTKEIKGVGTAQVDLIKSIDYLLLGADERALSIIHKFIRNLLKK